MIDYRNLVPGEMHIKFHKRCPLKAKKKTHMVIWKGKDKKEIGLHERLGGTNTVQFSFSTSVTTGTLLCTRGGMERSSQRQRLFFWHQSWPFSHQSCVPSSLFPPPNWFRRTEGSSKVQHWLWLGWGRNLHAGASIRQYFSNSLEETVTLRIR